MSPVTKNETLSQKGSVPNRQFSILARHCIRWFKSHLNHVLLINMGERDYAVEKDKNAIAQVVFLRNEHPKFVRTKRLKKTRRNTNGFGSTDTVQVCDGEREYNEEEDGGRC